MINYRLRRVAADNALRTLVGIDTPLGVLGIDFASVVSLKNPEVTFEGTKGFWKISSIRDALSAGIAR